MPKTFPSAIMMSSLEYEDPYRRGCTLIWDSGRFLSNSQRNGGKRKVYLIEGNFLQKSRVLSKIKYFESKDTVKMISKTTRKVSFITFRIPSLCENKCLNYQQLNGFLLKTSNEGLLCRIFCCNLVLQVISLVNCRLHRSQTKISIGSLYMKLQIYKNVKTGGLYWGYIRFLLETQM